MPRSKRTTISIPADSEIPALSAVIADHYSEVHHHRVPRHAAIQMALRKVVKQIRGDTMSSGDDTTLPTKEPTNGTTR